MTRDLVTRLVTEEIAKLPGDPEDYEQARSAFVAVAVADDPEFLTVPADERLA